MRNKLLRYGACVFETYELLEMLLYEVIKYRDTNPPAKRLMNCFSSIDGVLSASPKELAEVDGIGAKTAEYISSVGRACELLELKYGAKTFERYDTSEKAGQLVADYFADCHVYKVALFLFDNSMSLISVHDIAECDYESAAIKPELFIDVAISCGASIAIIAHSHPYGPLIPSLGDRETHLLISRALERVDILYLEHYIVSGNGYRAMTYSKPHSFFQRPDFVSFVQKRQVCAGAFPSSTESYADVKYDSGELLDFLCNVVFVSMPRERACELAISLLERCGELTKIFSLGIEDLKGTFGIPVSSVVHIKVIAALLSRRVTDTFNSNTKCTKESLESFFKALYLGYSVETIYAVMLDKKDRFVACEMVGEGTVNTSNVLPRRILEAAIRCKSNTVVISHNHPLGVPEPSSDDYVMTRLIFEALENSGVELRYHYVIAGTEHVLIDPIEDECVKRESRKTQG